MKAFDIVFLALSLALTAGTAWVVLAPSNAPLRAEIQTDSGLAIYPLSDTLELDAQGPLGSTHVHIQAGAVWVSDSDCTNKVCIAMGVIHHSGQWVACLPNHVFVRITGGTTPQDQVDVGVY